MEKESTARTMNEPLAITSPDANASLTEGSTAPIELVVFSDDWARHPSSCQHLVSQLLDHVPTLWVNTVGTRAPKLSREDLGKAVTKLWQWCRPAWKTKAAASDADAQALANLRVIAPAMYPGFRRGWQRSINARMISRAVNRALSGKLRNGAADDGVQRVAVTTLPITADLPGRLDVDRWVYYCVDDFSVWPGLDGSIMDAMERDLVQRVDEVIVVSETLRQRVASFGKEATVLTHGIDLDHWSGDADESVEPSSGKANEKPGDEPSHEPERPVWWSQVKGPALLFWGVVDKRLDTEWCAALARECGGTLILAGPQQSPDPALSSLDNVLMPGAQPYELLPTLARSADVLVMPYEDAPVTRAMQPLKFKEYLATGKPVVARRLPAIEAWADAADLTETSSACVEATRQRIAEGITESQRAARGRLRDESWSVKAATFQRLLAGA